MTANPNNARSTDNKWLRRKKSNRLASTIKPNVATINTFCVRGSCLVIVDSTSGCQIVKPKPRESALFKAASYPSEFA